MAASLLATLNPISAFPEYHGPYSVGTVDVEIPAADLPTACNAPEDAQPTIAFRIFYPCVKPSSHEEDRPVRWIPQPQRLTAAALLRFLGLKDRNASVLSYFPQQLYYIKLRAHRNAKLLEPPTSNRRWPVTVFSHGLAGSRNSYSYVCGDLASNGMMVIAVDHRDGSSPIQYVRKTGDTEAHVVDTVSISHKPNKEVWEARDKQLRIRLWEVSMVYEALVKIDGGQELENLDFNTSSKRRERVDVLQRFNSKMDLHRPGKVSWCGHSFGATTVTQLLKSVYYSAERPADAERPLLTPSPDSAIVPQITPESSTLLLDMWGLPLQSPDQAFLLDRPLPSYAVDGPEGNNVLSVLSEGFFKWQENLNFNKRVIAAPTKPYKPSATGKPLPAWARLRDESPSQDSGYASQDSQQPERSSSRPASEGSEHNSPLSDVPAETSPTRSIRRSKGPHMFYVQQSQHFSQSDFGILFPWLTRRLAKTEEPEYILELNTRAMVQVLREAGIELHGTNDRTILEPDGNVRKWMSVRIDGERTSETEPSATHRNLSFSNNAAPTDDVSKGKNAAAHLDL
ncbi:hypothetical protein LTR37_011339 [Vermiconidia calcicola]|uniref:Uncharacterized protein n=1 Tax=Vermiconidia calcicola TaxID=1690605 RepID=A0ACC3N485_9PEZI|nr:hypothetical protein LTR37_011339 [Vermiconidia calcicola]